MKKEMGRQGKSEREIVGGVIPRKPISKVDSQIVQLLRLLQMKRPQSRSKG